MKRLFIIPLIAISLLSVPGPRAGAQELMQSHHNPAVSLVDETLTYDIIYKWGFINKVAGYATLSLRNDGNLYRATLYGRNAPWANRIYMLRDTLYSTMTKQGLYPVKYVYIAHEEGKYKKTSSTSPGQATSSQPNASDTNGRKTEPKPPRRQYGSKHRE